MVWCGVGDGGRERKIGEGITNYRTLSNNEITTDNLSTRILNIILNIIQAVDTVPWTRFQIL